MSRKTGFSLRYWGPGGREEAGHDVRLDGRVRRVRRHTSDHDALVELSHCAIRIIPTRCEDDRALMERRTSRQAALSVSRRPIRLVV